MENDLLPRQARDKQTPTPGMLSSRRFFLRRWSLCNEIGCVARTEQEELTRGKDAIVAVKALDSTRPVTGAVNFGAQVSLVLSCLVLSCPVLSCLASSFAAYLL